MQIEKAWETSLTEIQDPSSTRVLELRLGRAKEEGLYEPESWPKPEGKK